MTKSYILMLPHIYINFVVIILMEASNNIIITSICFAFNLIADPYITRFLIFL